MKSLYDEISISTSKTITRRYSTSFSLGIRLLDRRFRDPIYSVYGFVRVADEIVDSFHDYDKQALLTDFRQQTLMAINNRISTNPVLNSFQNVYHAYGFTWDLVDQFLKSMEMDLEDHVFNQEKYEQYILGSAEVVGLMCLRIFTENNEKLYENLKPYAMKLGSAFQKINFLRDLNEDFSTLGRIYFPNVDMTEWGDPLKAKIINDIQVDFEIGLEGILMLPKDARLGVYIAYVYYSRLFKKISNKPASALLTERVRIPNGHKISLMCSSYLRHSFNLL